MKGGPLETEHHDGAQQKFSGTNVVVIKKFVLYLVANYNLYNNYSFRRTVCNNTLFRYTKQRSHFYAPCGEKSPSNEFIDVHCKWVGRQKSVTNETYK